MNLNEENHAVSINSIPKPRWKALMQLIPKIEEAEKFGSLEGGNEIANGIKQMPYWDHSPIVLEFLDIVYEMPVIISFDWGSWHEGREMASNSDFDFNTIDIPTKCKLITAIVRSDRFCDGALVSAFESGLILRILKSIEPL